MEAGRWAEVWAERVRRFGAAEALVAGGFRLTFQELDRDARNVAAALNARSEWRAGFRVGVETSRPDFFVQALGVWLAGGVLVPYSKAHWREDTRLKMLTEALVERFSGDDTWRPGEAFPGECDWHAVYLTSGSTGEPRAVVRGWRQALHEAECYEAMLGLSLGMKCSMLIDPVFGASTKHFLACLLAGCSQSFGSQAMRRGHVLYGTPGQVMAFSEAGAGNFRWVGMTGEACSSGAWEAACALAGQEGWILNALGGSEFGVAANQVVRASEGRPSLFCGVPLPGKELRILDEHGNPLLVGETGWLQVSSEHLAEGYLLPFGERLVFQSFPAAAGGRQFSSGDVGWLDAKGRLHHRGRAGKMQKRGARWIDTSPLERALESCVGLQEFALEWPAGGFRPVVWCGVGDSSTTIVQEVAVRLFKAGLNEDLMPSELRVLRQLPRNRHGKVDLKIPGPPGSEKTSGLKVHKIPSRVSLVAEALAEGDAEADIFQGAASFSELGFDSLALHELAVEISKRLQRRIPVLSLLSGNSLQELIGHLHGGRRWTQPDARKRPLLVWFGPGVASLGAIPDRSFEILHLEHDAFSEEIPWRRGMGIRDFAAALATLNADSFRQKTVFTGGFSFGSLLAHEAGVLLNDSGVTVQGVFLVDPPILDVRSIRFLWRWSKWRPGVWIFLLSLAPACGGGIFPKRMAKEIRMRDRERRRDMMRSYRPSHSTLSTLLFSSVAHSEKSKSLFSGVVENLQVKRLPALSHLDVVRQAPSVAEWTLEIRHFIHASTHPKQTISQEPSSTAASQAI